MAHLLILKGPSQGMRLALDRVPTFLGRDPDCQLVLDVAPGADRKAAVVVSRKHARVTHEKDRYFIEDGDGQGRASRNGTYVNGERVAFPGRVPLKHNDVIKICDFSVTFLDHLDDLPVPDDPESHSSIDAAISHDSSSVYLAHSAEKLQLLLQITNRLSTSLELDALLPEVVESLLHLFRQADHGFLILVDEATGGLLPQIVKSRRPTEESRIGFSATVVKQCIASVQALLSNDADQHFPTSESVADLALRSVMCAPLWSQGGKAFGVLLVDTRHTKNRFTQDDLNLLMGVANQASIALANARFHRDALARERLNRDLALAREVQRSFLPTSLPEIPGYQFFACNESALVVGGDYYDFVPLAGGRLGIFLGDVAGKGVAAALIMARFSAEARACLRTEQNLAAAICRLDNLMQPLGRTDRFVTLASLVLDPAAHTVTMVNAGHPSPLLVRKQGSSIKEVTHHSVIGPPLGVLENHPHEAQQLSLQSGDSLVLYSDGVSEALDVKGRQFGTASLRAIIGQGRTAPRELGERILQAVDEHAAGCDQHDDITLVCFGRD